MYMICLSLSLPCSPPYQRKKSDHGKIYSLWRRRSRLRALFD